MDRSIPRITVSNLFPASHGYPLRITAISLEFEQGGWRLGDAGHAAAVDALSRRVCARVREDIVGTVGSLLDGPD